MRQAFLSSPWRAFIFAIRPYKGRFAVTLLLVVMGNVVGYTMPQFLRQIADIVVAQGGKVTMSDLWLPFVMLGGVLVLEEVFFRTGHILETYVAPGVFRHITSSLYSTLIKRPTSYFENKLSGDLARRVEQIGSSVVYFVEDFPWEAGWVILSVIMAAINLSTTHPYILFTYLAWLAFFILTTIPLVMWHYRASGNVASVQASLSGGIIDTLSNIPLVHSFGAVTYERERTDKTLADVAKADIRMRWINVINKFQCGVSMILLAVSLTYVSVILFVRGQFSVGDFLLVSAIIPSLVGVVWSLGGMLVHISRRYGELADAVKNLEENAAHLVGGQVNSSSKVGASIDFSGVRFKYPGTSTAVFDSFSLNIAPGERVGIVGASGVGKSTLVKLLMRQYEFESGSVSIGGVSVRDYDLNLFHTLVSYVPQDTSLFHRSLLENIRYAKPLAQDAEVIEASRRAHADEFVRTLPDGYETKVGERGVKLSGGQRQRVALARAILKDAPILVLDEATSSLDTESESSIQEALSELFKGRTVIAIAHRLSTLRAMDRIVVLDQGRIVESGQPQDLLKNKDSIFKKMWDKQKNGFVE